ETKKPSKSSKILVGKEKQKTVDLEELISRKIREQLKFLAPVSSTTDFPEGKVIADFFLPYFCTTDGQGAPTIVQMDTDPVDDKKKEEDKKKEKDNQDPSNDYGPKKDSDEDPEPQNGDEKEPETEEEEWNIEDRKRVVK